MVCCGILQGCAVCCRWVLFGFLLSAIILSLMAVSSCHFVDVTTGGGVDRDDSIPSSLGLFRFLDDSTGVCTPYPEDQPFDEVVVKARNAGAIAPVVGTLALLILLVEFLCCRIPCSRPFVGALLMTAQICQGMSLLVFGSEDFCEGDLLQEIRSQTPCQLSSGSEFAIVAIILYFLSGVLLCCTPRPEPQSMRDYDVNSSKSSIDTVPSTSSEDEDDNLVSDKSDWSQSSRSGDVVNKTKHIV